MCWVNRPSTFLLESTTMNTNSRGVEAAQAGDLTKAEMLFKQAYAEDPSNQRIFQNIIRAMQMRGDIDGLIKYYEHARIGNSNLKTDKNIENQIIELALRAGRQQKVKKILSNRANQGDYSAAIIAPLTEILFENNELEQAKKLLVKAIEIDRNDPSLLTNLAIVETELGNYQIADRLHEEVIQKRPNEFLGYYNHSKFKLATGNPDAAEALLQKADSIVKNTKESKELQRLINEYKGNSESELAKAYAYIDKQEWQAAYNALEECEATRTTKKWLAAACELPETYLQMLKVNEICDPEIIVNCHQLLREDEKLIQDLIAAIREESSLAWNRADKPTTDGYQTYELLKDSKNKSIIKLKKKITEIISKSKDKADQKKLEKSISGWGVILQRGGYQKKHTHTDAEVSGVVYLKVPKEEENRAENGCLMFSGYQKKIVKPKPGMIVIFPSYLPHETIPYDQDSERICIAFNAMGKLS
jgi:Flp pilus assembly protein TadD